MVFPHALFPAIDEIYCGLAAPGDALWQRGQSHGRGDPGQPCNVGESFSQSHLTVRGGTPEWAWVSARPVPGNLIV